MSPILVRPVREQFEHDRVIRVLQAKYKRKYEVAINPGAEQNAAVGVNDHAMYPDLVLFSQERNRRVQGTIEVETAESINTLEAQAEWAPFSRLRTPFFLYVPATSIETVRRLCSEHAINPAEIWTYHTALDQVRFTMVHRSPDAPKGSIAEHKVKPVTPVAVDEPVTEEPAPAPAPRAVVAKAPARKPVVAAKAAPPGKPVRAAKSAGPVRAKAAKVAKAVKAPKAASKKPAKPTKGAKPVKAAKAGKATKSAKSAAKRK